MRYLIQTFRRVAMIVATCALILIGCLFVAGCEGDTILPAANPAAPSGGTTTVTNTTTVTVTIDRSDTEATPTPTSSTPTPTGVLPLPGYGEGVARDYAATHADQIAHSCQLVDGEAAWAFLDGLIHALQARDARWGYLCKDPACTALGRDVITYRASTGDTGIFIVDVLGNHCPSASDSPTQFRWGVLPFETVRRWSAHR